MRLRRQAAAPAQHLALALMLLALVIGILYYLVPPVHGAMPAGLPLLLMQATLLLSTLLGTSRAQWPPRPTPLRLVGVLVLAIDSATLALLFVGRLATVPDGVVLLASCATLGCLFARAMHPPAPLPAIGREHPDGDTARPLRR